MYLYQEGRIGGHRFANDQFPNYSGIACHENLSSLKEDDILLRKRKTKAKGRSPTIMTGVTGATGGLTLGKPSLLGM